MDAEAIKAMADLGAKAAGPVILTVPGNPAWKVWIRNAEGYYEEREVDDPHTQHAVRDVSSLARLAADALAIADDDTDHVEFFYSRNGVTLVYPGTARDTAKLTLTPSPQLKKLQEWESNRGGVSQVELIRTLRVVFKGLVSADIEQLVRKINVNVSSKSDVQRSGASLGKDIEARLGDNSKLPEYLTFTVPVFAEGPFAGLRAAVECAFDFDGQTNLFTVVPVSGAIEAAFTSAENTLAAMLADEVSECEIAKEKHGIYFGQP